MMPIDERLRSDDPLDPVYRTGRIAARILEEPSQRTIGAPRMSSPALGSGLLAAAVVIVVVAAAGALSRSQPPGPGGSPDDLAAQVLDRGAIRIAVTASHPQVRVGSGGLAGFDIDVAQEIAARLGVDLDLVILPAASPPSAGDGWDIALGPLEPGSASAGSTSPYAFWPHFIVTDPPAAPTDGAIAGRTVCAVGGDPGEAWARSVGATVVARDDDAACLDALSAGEADTIVTGQLSPADLALRPQLRVEADVVPSDPWVLATRPDPSAARLLAMLQETVAEMRADGTLSRLSQSRFGGADLSTDPAR